MSDELKQAVYVKIYTACSICLGKGSHDFVIMPTMCHACLGTGKIEKFITIDELNKLLKSSSL